MEVTPLGRSDAMLAVHQYQSFGVTTAAPMTAEQLENPDFWVNVASRFKMGDEIRVTDVTCSYYALLFVTYASGHNVRVRVLGVETFDREEVAEAEAPFKVQLMGKQKFCIFEKGVAVPLFTDIPTKKEADRALADHMQALAR